MYVVLRSSPVIENFLCQRYVVQKFAIHHGALSSLIACIMLPDAWLHTPQYMDASIVTCANK